MTSDLNLRDALSQWTDNLAMAGEINGNPCSFSDISKLAAHVNDRVSLTDGIYWGIYTEDPLMAAGALIGILNAGRTPLFLPHTKPDFLAKIVHRLDGLVLDAPISPIARPVITLDWDAAAASLSLETPTDWPNSVGFFTSGSTGEPLLVEKPLRGLEAEVRALEQSFGPLIAGGAILRTVSHQHIYGFLFCLLWPLMTGRRTTGPILRFPQDVMAAVTKDQGAALVTSPAFLQRAVPAMDLVDLAQKCRAMFSSGGPLAPEIAAMANAHAPLTLTEIYGSTETGGIAWRQVQDKLAPPAWRPFAGLDFRVAEDGLEIRSPYLSHRDWHVTGDLADADGRGGFYLKGRRDRIVKIEEKRLNLTEMERNLRELPDILNARLLVLEDRLRGLSAVVVPSPSGWSMIEKDGKAAFIHTLKLALELRFERVELPRRWRFVTAFPHNSQGKSPMAALAALFASPVTPPFWQDKNKTADDWCGETRIDPDLAVLEGHFPGEPVVAGVAQIAWVAEKAIEVFGLSGFNGNMTTIKFRRVITPGISVDLQLHYDRAHERIDFSFHDTDGIYSSGRMQIGIGS